VIYLDTTDKERIAPTVESMIIHLLPRGQACPSISPSPPEVVVRPRLIERLNEGLSLESKQKLANERVLFSCRGRDLLSLHVWLHSALFPRLQLWKHISSIVQHVADLC
jgi:hypothetical protein